MPRWDHWGSGPDDEPDGEAETLDSEADDAPPADSSGMFGAEAPAPADGAQVATPAERIPPHTPPAFAASAAPQVTASTAPTPAANPPAASGPYASLIDSMRQGFSSAETADRLAEEGQTWPTGERIEPKEVEALWKAFASPEEQRSRASAVAETILNAAQVLTWEQGVEYLRKERLEFPGELAPHRLRCYFATHASERHREARRAANVPDALPEFLVEMRLAGKSGREMAEEAARRGFAAPRSGRPYAAASLWQMSREALTPQEVEQAPETRAPHGSRRARPLSETHPDIAALASAGVTWADIATILNEDGWPSSREEGWTNAQVLAAWKHRRTTVEQEQARTSRSGVLNLLREFLSEQLAAAGVEASSDADTRTREPERTGGVDAVSPTDGAVP